MLQNLKQAYPKLICGSAETKKGKKKKSKYAN